jgi:hypothetical protein
MPAKLVERAHLPTGVMVTAAGFFLTLGAVLAPPAANALPVYARRTGLPCGQCHINPAGGGPRNAFGRAFARNGHQLPASKIGRSSRPSSRSSRSRGYGYYGYHGYSMGPGMMGGFGGGMMGGYGR